MTHQERKERSLETLHHNRETEVCQATIDWLTSHWKEAMDDLSLPINSDEELNWLHCQAVTFRKLLGELDESFEDAHE